VIQGSTPWALHAASLAQVLPLLASARYGRRLPPARRWVAVWCVALLAADAAQLWFRAGGVNNLWVIYFVVPLQNAIMLWALSLWQDDPVSRLAFRVAIPLDLLALAALIPAAQSASVFNQFTWPFQALVLLAGSLYTLVRRSSREPERVTSRDWFWVTLGTSLFFAFRMALPPFVQLTLSGNIELTKLAYVVSAWADIVAYILIVRGMVCPLPQARSGGSS
jgi:hypothetical protein